MVSRRTTRINAAKAALAAKHAASPGEVSRYAARAARLTAAAKRVREPSETGDWCILRTAGPSTLRLAETLAEAGIEAWTPQFLRRWCRPRSTVRQEREAAILPTFVFVRASQISEVYRALALPISPHPVFSVFRHAGRIPVLRDAQMSSLRFAELREAESYLAEQEREHINAMKAGSSVPAIGTEVRVGGAFTGLVGVVEGGRGKTAVINFGGKFTFAIEAWLLETDGVHAAAA